jgi:hypothetical protein
LHCKEGKTFFFEKKNQKTFMTLRACRTNWRARKVGKSFCFFFFRKRRLFLQSIFVLSAHSKYRLRASVPTGPVPSWRFS